MKSSPIKGVISTS